MIDFLTYDVWAQIVGFIASAFIITGFAHKGDSRFKMFMAMGSLTFVCHYFMLGAYAGAAVNVVSFMRTSLSIKFHKSNFMMIIFIAAYLMIGLFTYNSWVDILPIFAGISATIAMYKLSGIPMRLCFFATSASWLAYDFIFKSIGGIITEGFVQFTNIATIYRLMCDKKKA
jgi:hypothetical protein